MHKDDGEPGDLRVTRQVMWAVLPQLQSQILQLEEHEQDFARELDTDPYVSDYSYIEEVFMEQLLQPLLDAEGIDECQLSECAEFLELLLGIDEKFLTDMVATKVTHKLLGRAQWWRKFRPFAGPLLRKEIQEYSQYFTWPYPESIL